MVMMMMIMMIVVLCVQARGWASELCAGIEEDGYSANSCCYLFTINITLTDAGLAAGPGHGLAPVKLLFAYIKLLEQTGEDDGGDDDYP